MTNAPGEKPDFICIGAQKAGTSWLYWNLLFHPETDMPPTKELHYFYHLDRPWWQRIRDRLKYGCDPFIKGDTWHQVRNKLKNDSVETDRFYDPDWYRHFLYDRRTSKNFRKLFREKKGLTGPLSPALAAAGERVIAKYAEAAPYTKILYLVRDPVERMWSQLRMMYGDNLEHMSVEEIKKLFDLRLEHSHYSANIARWEKYFPGQISVWFYEDLVRDPVGFFKAICAYLGITPLEDFHHQKLKERVHESPSLPMPPNIRSHLQELLRPEVEAMHARFNHPCTAQWIANLDAEAPVAQQNDAAPIKPRFVGLAMGTMASFLALKEEIIAFIMCSVQYSF